MLFSILIANYNNSRFLENALRSLLYQHFQDWEAIVVDDASTDEFEEVAAKFAADPRIRIYRNEKNAGCGYTKARCAELASGALLAFLDPDDALDARALEVMEQAHRQHPECSLIHSTHYICDASLRTRRIAEYPRALPAGTPYLLVSDGSIHHFASFSGPAYRRTEGISPLNRQAVDQDLYYKLEEEGAVLFIDRPLYYYRIHAGAISNAGKEAAANLAHYAVIEEACQRRIARLRDQRASGDLPASGDASSLRNARYWIKKYRTRYYKIRIFHSFRRRHWGSFLRSLFIFPFVGGMGNLLSYSRKLPREGYALIRRSLLDHYEIK